MNKEILDLIREFILTKNYRVLDELTQMNRHTIRWLLENENYKDLIIKICDNDL